MSVQSFNPNQSLQDNTGVLSLLVYNQLFRKPNDPKYTRVQLSGEAALFLWTRHEDVEKEPFAKLVREWKSFGRSTSLVRNLAVHPAYQKIIGMGKQAIPLILNELQKERDHWFWALEAISRQDPVPEESKGDIEEMTRIWLQWGRERGYVR